MASKLGLEAKLYYADDGVQGTNFVELAIARDVTVNMDKALADVTTRKNNGWRAQRGTLKQGAIECQLLHDPQDAGWTFMQQLFFANDGRVLMQALDGVNPPASGDTSQGLHALFDMNQFNQAQPLEEALMFDGAFQICDQVDGSLPEWLVVTTP